MHLSDEPIVCWLSHLLAGGRLRYRRGETLQPIRGQPLRLPGSCDPAALGERTLTVQLLVGW